PTKSTLFPYTTLFRSKINKQIRKQERILKKETLSFDEYQQFEADLIKQSLYDKYLLKELTSNFETELNSINKEISILTDQIQVLDRKSTRLNSSHVKI